jgi:hypothetical protein
MKAPLALAAFALAACTTVPSAHAGPTAGLGQVAYTNGLRVRPLEVLEDSRCPALVRCVWEGRLVLRAEVIGGSWHQTRDLELGKPQQIADGTLTLIAAEPRKAAPGQIDPRAYRFTFDFQGGI